MESFEYNLMLRAGQARGESNDCSVRAIAIACNVPYDVAHAAMAAEGRKEGKGAYRLSICNAADKLGFDYAQKMTSSFHEQMKGQDAKCRNLTPFQIRKYAHLFQGSYLIFTDGHVFASVDGVVHDFNNGRKTHVIAVIKLTKREA